MRNSHLSSALLLELQDECGINANAADFDRLELHTNPFLEKQMQVPLLLPLLLPLPFLEKQMQVRPLRYRYAITHCYAAPREAGGSCGASQPVRYTIHNTFPHVRSCS